MSMELDTAQSYLDDVRRQTDDLDKMDNHLMRQKAGYEIIRGDLELAQNEADRVMGDEKSLLLARCFNSEGLIKVAMARGWGKYFVLPEGKQAYHQFISDAGQAFTNAVNQDPQPLYYYNLGLALKTLNRNYEAVQAFEQAMKGDNPKTAIDARKEIGRIGPVDAISTIPSSGSGFSTQPYGASSAVNGTLILILGILGIVVLPIIFGPIAWIMGNNALAKLNAGGDQSQRGMVNAGRTCGVIGAVIGVLCVIWLIYSIYSTIHQSPFSRYH